MTRSILHFEQLVPRPVGEVFSFFADARNLERITPPFLRFRVVAMSTPEIQEGTELDYTLVVRGFPVRWRSRVEEWVPNERFVDRQIRGPYAYWHHTHRFEETDGCTLIADDVVFGLPLGRLGALVAGAWVRRDVRKIFDYRRRVVADVFGAKDAATALQLEHGREPA